MAKIVGIDLGTSNSAIASHVLATRVYENAEGSLSTPSSVTVLAADGDCAFVVGQPSKDLLKQYPTQTIRSIKRLMGREFGEPDVQSLLKGDRLGYSVITEDSEPGSLRVSVQGQLFSPENISAEILKKLIADTQALTGETITQAVVTVPAYFADRQKFATRAACEQAGLSLLRLLPEPTAAALSYGFHEIAKDNGQTLMVFDLGGGTFDLSILSVVNGHFMEITKGGDMWLGGDDIDRALHDYTLKAFQEANPSETIATLIDQLEPSKRAKFSVELLSACEQAKIALSSEEETRIELFGALRGSNGQLLSIDVPLSRSTFEDIISPILQKLTEITKNIMEDIRFEPALIDTVLMVGGSSLIPAVQEALRKEFGSEKVVVHPRPMFAVVEGAAIMAQNLAAKSDETPFELMHSTAHDYYLQLAGGQKHLLVARNTPLPCEVEENLVFAQEGQELARLRIFNSVDGILEPVGDMWAFRAPCEPLAPLQAPTREKTSLTLKFAIDESNIIRISTKVHNSLTPEQSCEITRGGISSWLFAQLEQKLSQLTAEGVSPLDIINSMRFVQILAKEIVQVTNPATGQVDKERKNQVLEKILNLQIEVGPLALYLLHSECASVLPLNTEDREEFMRHLEALRYALEAADCEKMIDLEDTMEDMLEDKCPRDFLRTLYITQNLKKSYPSHAKKLTHTLQKWSQALLSDDSTVAHVCAYEAEIVLAEFSSSTDDRQTASFDRDVMLQG